MDLDVSAMFYVDTLGLTLTERTPFALVVDGGNGVELRITLVQSKADTGYTVLGWQMDDLDAAVEELRSRGWSSAGTRAWIRTSTTPGRVPTAPGSRGSGTRTRTCCRVHQVPA